MRSVRVIGPGRAGTALSRALAAAGWSIAAPVGRGHDMSGAAAGVDLLVIATTDDSVAEVAAAVAPQPETVVAHLAGSLGLDVLELHPRRASLHPLRAIPDPTTSLHGASFAVAGDPLIHQLVADIGGRAIAVEDEHRVAYHAAACIASNHLVALLGQVDRVASTAGVPLSAYLDLVRSSIDRVAEMGPQAALTGPASRGDLATIAAHRAALDPDELEAYDALLAAARRLIKEEARV